VIGVGEYYADEGYPTEEELILRELERRRREALLRQRLAEEARRRELQKQQLLRAILTPKARQRLTNIRMVRPELAQRIELLLIQLAQQGRIPVPLDDKAFKELLKRVLPEQREIKIRFKRV